MLRFPHLHAYDLYSLLEILNLWLLNDYLQRAANWRAKMLTFFCISAFFDIHLLGHAARMRVTFTFLKKGGMLVFICKNERALNLLKSMWLLVGKILCSFCLKSNLAMDLLKFYSCLCFLIVTFSYDWFEGPCNT